MYEDYLVLTLLLIGVQHVEVTDRKWTRDGAAQDVKRKSVPREALSHNEAGQVNDALQLLTVQRLLWRGVQDPHTVTVSERFLTGLCVVQSQTKKNNIESPRSLLALKVVTLSSDTRLTYILFHSVGLKINDLGRQWRWGYTNINIKQVLFINCDSLSSIKGTFLQARHLNRRVRTLSHRTKTKKMAKYTSWGWPKCVISSINRYHSALVLLLSVNGTLMILSMWIDHWRLLTEVGTVFEDVEDRLTYLLPRVCSWRPIGASHRTYWAGWVPLRDPRLAPNYSLQHGWNIF